jgi:hypothetical protein
VLPAACRTASYLAEGIIFLYVGMDALDPLKWQVGATGSGCGCKQQHLLQAVVKMHIGVTWSANALNPLKWRVGATGSVTAAAMGSICSRDCSCTADAHLVSYLRGSSLLAGAGEWHSGHKARPRLAPHAVANKSMQLCAGRWWVPQQRGMFQAASAKS